MSTRTKTPNGKTDVLIHAPRKLDIACGQRKQAGYKGIDIAGNPDIVHDLNDFPWPIKTSSVKEVFCSHYVEHIPHWMPGWERDGWWMFFDELYRIMAKGATALFFHPYAKSDRAFWDPTHTRYVHEMTWYYLNREWREAQGLDHYNVSCNFEPPIMSATGVAQSIAARNDEAQAFAREHYWNVLPDLQINLTVIK